MSIMENELIVTNLLELRYKILELGVDVVGAKAKGVPVHTNGHLGVDVLRVEAGDSFPIHTHAGDHLLLCLEGKGTISIGRKTYHVVEGDIYMVAGMIPHAVGAASDSHHVLAAIGAPHRPIDSPNRMTATDWDGNIVESAIYI